MLKKKYDLNFTLIENLKNKQAKEKYKNIDILIDQLFAGWYGGVAVEVMALGKPVISYIREKDLIYVPKKMRDQLPIINTSPKTIYSTLEKILNTPRNQILYLGKKSRTYVEKWHNPKKIAKRIKKDVVEAMS